MAGFRWTPERTTAAELVAKGELTYQDVANRVGIAYQTLWDWRNRPEFMARVEVHREAERAEIYERGIARRELRVKALSDRWNRLRRIIEARADDLDTQKAPGGSTGLLARKLKGLGSGDSFQIVEEFELDAALLRELREHEKQAAIELGQWKEPGAKQETDLIVNTPDEPTPPNAGNTTGQADQRQDGDRAPD